MANETTKETVNEEVITTPEKETGVPVMKSYLEKDVRLKVFVIGVGNAGNQTIVYAHKEGMDVFAVNSSIKDLSDQIVSEDIQSFIVGSEARGSGKNVEKGKALFQENGRQLFQTEYFINKCQEADVIFVVSATGGGTGPSVSPEICRVLTRMFPKKVIRYHGITPKNSDSNVAFGNTAYCVNEIKKLNIPYTLTDLEWFADDPNDEAFTKADKHAVEVMKVCAGQYLRMSSSQMIDENDLKTVISEPGYTGVYIVNDITSNQLEKKSMQSMVIDRIRKGPAVMMQKDGISMQMAVIINCPDDMEEVSRTGDYSEIFDFVGHKPKNGIFENYGTTNGTTAQMIVILSGMTYPINRIQYYIQSVQEQEEFMKKQKDIDISGEVDAVQALLSGSSQKLDNDTSASEDQINSVLDSFF